MTDNPKVFLSSPHMSGHEQKYLSEAFNQNWIGPLGPNVENFEKELSSYTGSLHVAALNSGTSAMHLALILLGVKSGDTVIAQSFTFAATINPIVYLGAKPILVDSEEETWNMCPALLDSALSDIKKRSIRKGSKIRMPKAILAVNLYGMPAKWDEILQVSKNFGVPVIEDGAESLGSSYKGVKCGSLGAVGVLSFNGNKIITTSNGGALISNDEGIIRKARFLSTQARDIAPHYEHTQIGYNYRMSNILAGVGRGQMEVLNSRIIARRRNNALYKELLSCIPGVTFQNEPSEDYYSNYWLTAMQVNPTESGGVTQEKLRSMLWDNNIESRPVWKPMHLQPVFKEYQSYSNGNSERYFNNGICLPSGSNLSEEERERVVNIIKRGLKSVY
jgi:dTDP-4-amino-4,6-dideoxygalactose transaminase